MASVDSDGPKDALFEAIAVMGKAFASPRRLELIDLLAQSARSVDELASASGQSNANTSQHLQALHAAGIETLPRDSAPAARDARLAQARQAHAPLALDGAVERNGADIRITTTLTRSPNRSL